MRLLELCKDIVAEDFNLLIVPLLELVLVLDREAVLSEGDDLKDNILLASMSGDETLSEAASFGEEDLSGLVGFAVGSNSGKDVDRSEVGTVHQHRHGSHGGSLDPVTNSDATHGLADFVTSTAHELKEAHGVVELESEAVKNLASFGGAFLVENSNSKSVFEFLGVVLSLDGAGLLDDVDLVEQNAICVLGGQIVSQNSAADVLGQLHELERGSWLDDDSLAAIVKHVGSNELKGLSSRELHSLTEAASLGLGQRLWNVSVEQVTR